MSNLYRMKTEKWPKQGYGASIEACSVGDAGIPLSQALSSHDSLVLTTANVVSHSYTT